MSKCAAMIEEAVKDGNAGLFRLKMTFLIHVGRYHHHKERRLTRVQRLQSQDKKNPSSLPHNA